MNIEKLTKEIGSMDSEFIDEALDYAAERQRGGIIMRKRKTGVLVAAVLLMLAVSACAVAKEMINLSLDYFASLEDGTAVVAPSDSVKVSVETIDGISVKFVIDEDESVYPFNEYTELMICGYSIYNGISQYCSFSSMHDPRHDDNFGEISGSFGSSVAGAFSFRYDVNGREMYFIKEQSDGEYAKVRKYTLVIDVIYGRNADGELMEIRGDWKVNFKL